MTLTPQKRMDCGVVITTTKLRGKQILNTKNKNNEQTISIP